MSSIKYLALKVKCLRECIFAFLLMDNLKHLFLSDKG